LDEIEAKARSLKDAERKTRVERRARDRLFLKAQAAGATRRQIGEAAGISEAAVKFVLRRGTP
jgi:hypothetical protein